MADTTDLKSVGEQSPCRFESGQRYHFIMNVDKQPNPKIHFYISIVKSVVRIVAGLTLIGQLFAVTGWCLIVAEVLGILEEIF